jgi:uncharacterized membrane protein
MRARSPRAAPPLRNSPDNLPAEGVTWWPRPGLPEARLHGVLDRIADGVGTGCELAALLALAAGLIYAVARALAPPLRALAQPGKKREIRIGFASWVLLSLEFALAADIARTAISPSWNDIGQLAAIAAIRTALNYFLERDLQKLSESGLASGHA